MDLLECVIKLLRFECVAWISVESPSSDRVSRSHGWKNIARVWITSYCKPIPPLSLLLYQNWRLIILEVILSDFTYQHIWLISQIGLSQFDTYICCCLCLVDTTTLIGQFIKSWTFAAVNFILVVL